MLVPVYDIKNCGPRHRFAANGKLVHNSDSINMQNLPRVSPLKKAIVAPKGYVIVDCDSSQIEARTLAWMAGQYDLVEAFAKGEDVYKIMASAIYGVPVEEVTKDQRFVGKTTILGAGYGMGAKKFQAQLKTFGVELPLDECEYIISVYRATYPRIPEVWAQGDKALRAMLNDYTAPLGLDGVLLVEDDRIRFPNGMYLQYPNLRRWTDPETDKTQIVYDNKRGRTVVRKGIWGGGLTENWCQGLARIVVGEQMLKIAKRYKVAMTVHDSVVAVVPEAEAEEGQAFIEKCMRWTPKWAEGLPLNCESHVGPSYGG